MLRNNGDATKKTEDVFETKNIFSDIKASIKTGAIIGGGIGCGAGYVSGKVMQVTAPVAAELLRAKGVHFKPNMGVKGAALLGIGGTLLGGGIGGFIGVMKTGATLFTQKKNGKEMRGSSLESRHSMQKA